MSEGKLRKKWLGVSDICQAQQVSVGRMTCSLKYGGEGKRNKRKNKKKGQKTWSEWLSIFPAEAAASQSDRSLLSRASKHVGSDRSLSRTSKQIGSDSIPSNSKSEQTRHTKEGVERGIIIQNS